MSKTIVKIQRSLFSSGNEATMLIYDQSKSIYAVMPLSDDIIALLGNAPKGYFSASVDHTGVLKIYGKINEQNW